MYVKSESGRGPVWLRELRILCKLCKLWTERRSSRSSRVDLNALITRSCKNREGSSIRKRGGKPATHKHAIFSFRLFFLSRRSVCVHTVCTYVCMHARARMCVCVCMCVTYVSSPFSSRRCTFCPISFRFPCVPCTCYQRIHWYCRRSRGCCLVLCIHALTGPLTLSFLLFYLSLYLFLVSSNFLSLHTTRDVSSIAVDLVAFHPNS